MFSAHTKQHHRETATGRCRKMRKVHALSLKRHAHSFWGAEGAPILFSDLGIRMASCSYTYIYIYTVQVTIYTTKVNNII